MEFTNLYKSILINVFVILINTLGVSQNPFDIKSRLISQRDTTLQSVQSQTNNPFDLKNPAAFQIYNEEKGSNLKQSVNPESVKKVSRLTKIAIFIGGAFLILLFRAIDQKNYILIFKSFINPIKLNEYRNVVNGLFDFQMFLFSIFFAFNAAYFIFLIHQLEVVSFQFIVKVFSYTHSRLLLESILQNISLCWFSNMGST